MSDGSAIEWTDATWNPVRGCTKVSPGCAYCYAETFAERFRGVKGHPYEQGFDLRLVPDKLTEPLSWKKPRRVFVNSMSDLFQDGVQDEYIDNVFAIMACSPRHTFQVLTKRAARMLTWARSRDRQIIHEAAKGVLGYHNPYRRAVNDWPLPNVWLGVSVENQHFADERIPLLLQTPSAVRFISAEPLLGPVDLTRIPYRNFVAPGHTMHGADGVVRSVLKAVSGTHPPLDWVIVGGESGPNSRPFDVEWARSIARQCKYAGVPCFMKQVGSRPIGWWTNELGPPFNRVGLRDKKGGDPAEWPADLRVRQFPEARITQDVR